MCCLSTNFMFTKLVSMEKLKKTCGLCSKTINDGNFKIVDQVIKDILDTLLLKLISNGVVQHLLCNSCSEKLFAAYNFKWMCLSTNKTITPHLEESSSVDLKQIYVKEEGNHMLDNKEICCLCIQPVNNKNIPLQDIQTDAVRAYIPEIEFKVTEDPVVCKMCHYSLLTHSNFLKNCLNVKQRTSKDDCTIMDTILSESDIKTEQIEIKHENEENEDRSSEGQFIEIPFKEEVKQESMDKRNDNEYNLETHDKRKLPNHPLKTEHMSEVKICDTLELDNDFSKQEPKDSDSSELQTYKCSDCEYETKYKVNLTRHQLKHKKSSEVQMYKCSICGYETRYEICYTSHQLVHKDRSQVKMYKCDECKFETKHRKSLKKHQSIHKDPSEVRMHKCSECQYESRYKNCLEIHQLRHKSLSKLEMYKCNECTFESRYKNSLRQHQMKHKDPSEVQIYKCSTCQYETRHRRYIRIHETKHKNPSEGQRPSVANGVMILDIKLLSGNIC